ncbi:hypothetical protein [Pseudotenacibaculum haliotis]|uniref:Uncharacterized protein n=1 Tax=Pseudotenacibaculum haliotis TaxID=1862138 RepID=A0ABW5LV37_9FLAO
MIARILKNLSLLYAFLLILGYIYLHTYYESFNIEIYSYLTTNEILLIFLNLIYPVLSILALFLITIIVCLITYWIIETFIKIIFKLLRALKKTPLEQIKQQNKSNIQINLSLIISLFISSGFIFYALFKLTRFWGIGSIIIPVIYFLIHSKVSKIKISNNSFISFKTSKFRFDIFSLAFFFIVMSWYYGYAKAELIQKNSYFLSFSNISFIYDHKRIIPNDSLIYLGSTNKYFFYRDKKNSISKIYPIDKVENILSGDEYDMLPIRFDEFSNNWIKNLKLSFPKREHHYKVTTSLNDCKNIQVGKFSLGNFLIERSKTTQTEFNGYYGGKIKQYRIVWKSSCEYFIYNSNDSLIDRRVITKITDSTYTRLSARDSSSYTLRKLRY